MYVLVGVALYLALPSSVVIRQTQPVNLPTVGNCRQSVVMSCEHKYSAVLHHVSANTYH